MTQQSEAKIIKASAKLQQKVGAGNIDDEKITRAQSVMDNNQVDFAALARPFLAELQGAVERVRQEVGDEKALQESLSLPIMNLKANAATFNFPLVSDMTGTVLNFIEHIGKTDKDVADIADSLHRAVTLVIVKKIEKDSPTGAALTQEFRDVCKRYLDKRLLA